MAKIDLVGAVTGLPKWLRYGIAVVVGALLIWGGWNLWLWQHDKGVIEQDRADTRAKVNETMLDAEREANRKDEARRVVRERQTDELETAREEAIKESPDETSDIAGPATRAVLRELRRQADSAGGPAD